MYSRFELYKILRHLYRNFYGTIFNTERTQYKFFIYIYLILQHKYEYIYVLTWAYF